MRTKANSRRTRRKAKPLKATYKEIVGNLLSPGIMIEEDKLLTLVVCKKYKTTRARKTRKLSARLKLKEGEALGEFRRLKVGSKDFWRPGDGSPSLNNSDRKDNDETESEARKASTTLEKFLLNLCNTQLNNSITFIIPQKTERELIKRWSGRNKSSVKNKIDLLKFASIRDFGWIISENWKYFTLYFNNRGDFISKIKELNVYRNRLTHPNLQPMSKEEMQYFTLAVYIFIKTSK